MHQLEVLPSTEMRFPTNSSDTTSGLWTEIVHNKMIFCYCLGLMTTALLTGFDTVVIGTITALPHFQQVISGLQPTGTLINIQQKRLR